MILGADLGATAKSGDEIIRVHSIERDPEPKWRQGYILEHASGELSRHEHHDNDGEARSLHVWAISGQKLAEIPSGQLNDVKALKRELQHICGLPRFQQQVVHDGTCLDDTEPLATQTDVQVILLPFRESSPAASAMLMRAVELGWLSTAEKLAGG